MSSGNILERLAKAKEESKRVDNIKTDLHSITSEIDTLKEHYATVLMKLSQIQDQMSGKVRQDELYDLKMKMSKDIEDLKKHMSSSEGQKKIIEEVESKYTSKEEFEKEIEEIKIGMETYVKNQPTQMVNKEYELRLKKLEDIKKPVPVVRGQSFK